MAYVTLYDLGANSPKEVPISLESVEEFIIGPVSGNYQFYNGFINTENDDQVLLAWNIISGSYEIVCRPYIRSDEGKDFTDPVLVINRTVNGTYCIYLGRYEPWENRYFVKDIAINDKGCCDNNKLYTLNDGDRVHFYGRNPNWKKFYAQHQYSTGGRYYIFMNLSFWNLNHVEAN